MIIVTMTDGTARQYNRASTFEVHGEWLRVASGTPSISHVEAELRERDVMRIEFTPPCKVWKVRTPTSRKVT